VVSILVFAIKEVDCPSFMCSNLEAFLNYAPVPVSEICSFKVFGKWSVQTSKHTHAQTQ